MVRRTLLAQKTARPRFLMEAGPTHFWGLMFTSEITLLPSMCLCSFSYGRFGTVMSFIQLQENRTCHLPFLEHASNS